MVSVFRTLICLLLVLLLACENTELVFGDSCGNYPHWFSTDYVLPYPIGESYLVLQGNCVDWNTPGASHFGHDRYAYEFKMDEGRAVSAARSGKVVFVRESFTNQDKGLNQGNVIVIRHSDSTFAAYGHLQHESIIPQIGSEVQQGEIIGYSGNSGLSSIPHLHFHVSLCLDQALCGTLPITFRNTLPNPQGLQPDEVYPALAY